MHPDFFTWQLSSEFSEDTGSQKTVRKAGPIVYPEFILKNQYSLSIINKAQQIVHFEVKEENFRGIFMEKNFKRHITCLVIATVIFAADCTEKAATPGQKRSSMNEP